MSVGVAEIVCDQKISFISKFLYFSLDLLVFEIFAKMLFRIKKYYMHVQ
jgi:hypothetical protein